VIAAPRTKIPALTGLRAVAAFWVLMLHFGDAVTTGWPLAFRRVFSGGFIGVDLFFVLSGFILSWNYLGNDCGLTSSRADFWRARAARILPLYYASLALALPLFLLLQFQQGISPEAIRSAAATVATTLTLMQSWARPISNPWNNPAWSLSVEVSLYLSFPFLAAWVARKQARKQARKPLHRVLQITAVTYGVTILGALAFAALHAHPSVWKWEPDQDPSVWIPWLGCNPLVHFHELLLGSVAYLCLREEQTRARNEWMSGPKAVWISSLAMIILLVWRGPIPFMAALMGIYSPLFALLIYGLAKQRGLVARILSTPAFVFLGEISFALYLVHLTVWSMMGGFNLEHSYIKQDSAVNFLVCVILSLAIATILYKFIEVPYRKTLRKHWKTAPSVPVPDLCEN
jgi:peptidoglycan/LPS O-acetylase OafA/YrhL